LRRGNEPKWIYLPNGDLAGVSLSSDFCAEHEWGVDGLRRLLGCDSSLDGVERRQIRTLPVSLRLHSGIQKHPSDRRKKGAEYDSLFLSPVESYYRSLDDWMDSSDLRVYGDKTLAAAWDQETFGIAAYGEKDKKNLKTLWDAFQAKDIAFWPNIGVFHMGAGLIFCIASKIPENDLKQMLTDDLDHKELIKNSEAIGLEKELKAAGKAWYALSPKWAKETKHKTAFPVVYWLNPQQQDRTNYGMFTVEDLRLWAQDKGPIPMTAEQVRARMAR